MATTVAVATGNTAFTFARDTELEVVTSFDEVTEQAETTNERFVGYQRVHGHVLRDDAGTLDIQFGDGSVAYSVAKSRSSRRCPRRGNTSGSTSRSRPL